MLQLPWEDDREAYSDDLDWMPQVVLLAKNAHVWLARFGILGTSRPDLRAGDGIPGLRLLRR